MKNIKYLAFSPSENIFDQIYKIKSKKLSTCYRIFRDLWMKEAEKIYHSGTII